MKSIEAKAKTVHEAIENACAQLGVAQDEVNVEILSQGGMFAKAKVLVTTKENKTDSITETKEITQQPQTEKTKAKKIHTQNEPKVKPTENKIINTDDGQPACLKLTKTSDFVIKLIELLENGSTVTTETTENSFNININGGNVGKLIGKGGEVLNAIQTLVSSIAISNANGEVKRVFVNIEDYKERRSDSLKALALKKADFVKTSGKFVKLDPMNARDRAIIHTALQEIKGIHTFSTGNDPFRCLCIAPGEKTATPSNVTK